jgi:hypothetical protein
MRSDVAGVSAAVEFVRGVGFKEGGCNCALCVHGRIVGKIKEARPGDLSDVLEHSWDGIHEQAGSKEMDWAFALNELEAIAELGQSKAAERAKEAVRVLNFSAQHNTADHEDPKNLYPALHLLARNALESGMEIGELIEELRTKDASR